MKILLVENDFIERRLGLSSQYHLKKLKNVNKQSILLINGYQTRCQKLSLNSKFRMKDGRKTGLFKKPFGIKSLTKK